MNSPRKQFAVNKSHDVLSGLQSSGFGGFPPADGPQAFKANAFLQPYARKSTGAPGTKFPGSTKNMQNHKKPPMRPVSSNIMNGRQRFVNNRQFNQGVKPSSAAANASRYKLKSNASNASLERSKQIQGTIDQTNQTIAS